MHNRFLLVYHENPQYMDVHVHSNCDILLYASRRGYINVIHTYCTCTCIYLNSDFSWLGIESKSECLASFSSNAKLERKRTKVDKSNGQSSIIIIRIIGRNLSIRRPLELREGSLVKLLTIRILKDGGGFEFINEVHRRTGRVPKLDRTACMTEIE